MNNITPFIPDNSPEDTFTDWNEDEILNDSFIFENAIQEPGDNFRSSTPDQISAFPIEDLDLPFPDISVPSIFTSSSCFKTTLLDLDMAKSIICQKYSGYPHENGDKFLSEFESYATLIDVTDNNNKKIAAFHLHLLGPALAWFNALPQSTKNTWDNLIAEFKSRFITIDWQSPQMFIENETFNKLCLLAGQPMEDFHCLLLEKGQLIRKQEHEILARFISGLPQELAFFVRAGNPKDLSSALIAAKMGESCGYRKHSEDSTGILCAMSSTKSIEPPQKQEINDLKAQMEKLTNLVEAISTKQSPQHSTSQPGSRPYNQPRQPSNPRRQQYAQDGHSRPSLECFACHGLGHPKRLCNWTGIGESAPGLKCQLCQQWGHPATDCRFLGNNAPQGNQQHPGWNRPPSSGNPV
ncbi:hypothetical protein CI610_02906 [invertebrate metagenome]|uniref:Retrotransposon gag domain-containing protein n=1 Tax=invertebrate metagenome TaxID=1711999 RepID=A0A2H9T4M3_9ZZZZ